MFGRLTRGFAKKINRVRCVSVDLLKKDVSNVFLNTLKNNKNLVFQ